MKTLLFTLLILLSSELSAEIVHAEGSSKIDCGELGLLKCRTIATENAKLDALEKIGVAVQSEFTLTEQSNKKTITSYKANVYTAGILKIDEITKSEYRSTDNTYSIKLKASVDYSKMEEYLKSSPETKKRVEKLAAKYNKLIVDMKKFNKIINEIQGTNLNSRDYILKDTNNKLLVTINEISKTREKVYKTVFDIIDIKNKLNTLTQNRNIIKKYADSKMTEYIDSITYKIELVRVNPTGQGKFTLRFNIYVQPDKKYMYWQNKDNKIEKDIGLDNNLDFIETGWRNYDGYRSYFMHYSLYAKVTIKDLGYTKYFNLLDHETTYHKYIGLQYNNKRFCLHKDKLNYYEGRGCFLTDDKNYEIVIPNIDKKDVDKVQNIDVTTVIKGFGYDKYFTDFQEYHDVIKDML